ncbi:MAG: flagellar assembly protein FliW [Bacillota bacterium]
MSSTNVEDKVFEFPAGLFGFPSVRRFIVGDIPGGGDIFRQLVAIDEPQIGFTLVHPAAFFPTYAPDIPAEDLREIAADNTEQVLLYVIAKVPQNFKEATANLRAPLIFNPFTRKGRQVILADDRYKAAERLFQV